MTYSKIYSRSKLPLYAQVANQLKLKIKRGDWTLGTKIPKIEDLQKEFDLSKITIRDALKILEDEGLVKRQRGRGTFVSKILPSRGNYILPNKWKDLIRILQSLKPKMIAPITELDASKLPRLMTGQAEGPYVKLQRVHCQNEEPYCLINIFLSKDTFNLNADKFKIFPVIYVLDQDHPELIDSVRQIVTFSIADKTTAKVLGIGLGESVVKIERTMIDRNERVIVHTQAEYPGEFVRFEVDFDI